MKPKPELRARRGLCDDCRTDVGTLTRTLRARRKAEGRCVCGNDLPLLLVTPLGRPVLKECLECMYGRDERALKPLVLTTALDPETREHRFVITKRGRPTSVDLFRAAKEWREELPSKTPKLVSKLF